MRPPTITTEERGVPPARVASPTVQSDAGPSMLPRRMFLRRVGIGAATAFVAADATIAYRAYDQGVLAGERGPAFDAWTTWRDGTGPMAMVSAAVLAASAHNTQPWRFAVGESRIDLYADAQRSTGANDPLDRELDVSLGCAVENLCLSARARGREPDVDLAVDGPDGRAARVRLMSRNPVESQLHAAIPNRHSNRSEYRADPLPTRVLSALDDLVDDSVAPARLVWLTSGDDRRRVADLLVAATRAHVADDEQSRASFDWWRSDWDEIQRHKDGLNIDGVGLPPLVRALGKLLPATSRRAADDTFIERTKLQARSAAAFGVIVVDDPSVRAQRLAGGRLVQRLHLWAAANDLGFQHMNQITERIDRDRQRQRPDEFGSSVKDLVGGPALVAFRLGTPTLPALRSPRRPVVEVLR